MELVLLLLVVALILWWRRRHAVPVVPVDLGPLPWVEGVDWRVVRPLMRAEARFFLRHPAFLIGVLATPLMLVAATSDESSWHRLAPGIALAIVPLGWATIVTTTLLTLRARRSGANELLASAPAPQPVRSAALLLTGVPAAAVAAVIAAAWVALLFVLKDTSGSVVVADVATGVLIVAGAVTVGVSVARFLPRPVFGFAAAIAVMFIQARFFELDAWPWYRTEAEPERFLAFLAEPTSVGTAVLEVRPSGWHLLYLIGLIAVMACVALSRDHPPRRFAPIAVTAVAVVAVTGWLQLRPPSDARLATMVSYVTEPERHQECTTFKVTTYCAYPEQRDRVEDWRARVTAVRALLPGSAASRPLRVSDRVPTLVGNSGCSPMPFLDALHPLVAEAVTAEAVWPADGDVHPGTNTFPCSNRSSHELFTAVQVGLWAVGLPPSPHSHDVRCAGAGQARSVIALWLGAAATPKGAASLREIADEHAGGTVSFADWSEPPMWGTTFATADVQLAIGLLEQPQQRVRDTLAGAWDRLLSPETPSSELAAQFGTPTKGAPLEQASVARCR